MQMRDASHPNLDVVVSKILGWKSEKKVRSDVMRQVVEEEGYHQEKWMDYAILKYIQMKHLWNQHQSMGLKARGRCCWEKCPGLKKSKEKLSRATEQLTIARNAVPKWD